MAWKLLCDRMYVFKCNNSIRVLSLNTYTRPLIGQSHIRHHNSLTECFKLYKWQKQTTAQYCLHRGNSVHHFWRQHIRCKISCSATKTNFRTNAFQCRYKSSEARNPGVKKPTVKVESKQSTLPKTSEVKRLLNLSAPEKWRILGTSWCLC